MEKSMSMSIIQISALAIIACCNISCLLLLYLLNENFSFLNHKVFFSLVPPFSSLCFGLSCLLLMLLLKTFTASLFEVKESTFSRLLVRQAVVSNNRLKFCFGLLCFLQIILLVSLPYEKYIQCLLLTIYCGTIPVFVLLIMGYDSVDLAKSQNDQCSIGAYWATGAVQAYYQKSLKHFNDRLRNFEANNPDVQFFVKKLVLIAPLSCYIEGSLKDRDEITYVGDLEPIECDQGANINRHLKTSVYKISRDENIFIAAEFPSPLGTLWAEKERMAENVRIYIRDCFLKELKEQLKPYPVIILEYDDKNSSTPPLHHFIASSLKNYLMENNYYL